MAEDDCPWDSLDKFREMLAWARTCEYRRRFGAESQLFLRSIRQDAVPYVFDYYEGQPFNPDEVELVEEPMDVARCWVGDHNIVTGEWYWESTSPPPRSRRWVCGPRFTVCEACYAKYIVGSA
ncbi:MAG TPA: hypothetical protein VNK04_19880 [Gemmataceae bacterium]|nr:hypothetical protein [Gemmataceae bacterium]